MLEGVESRALIPPEIGSSAKRTERETDDPLFPFLGEFSWTFFGEFSWTFLVNFRGHFLIVMKIVTLFYKAIT